MLLLLIGCAFAGGLTLQADGGLVNRTWFTAPYAVSVTAFIVWFSWRFVSVFPKGLVTRRLALTTLYGKHFSFIVSCLLLINGFGSIKPFVDQLAPPGPYAGAVVTQHWTVILALSAAAVVVMYFRTRMAVREDKPRVRLFLGHLLVVSTVIAFYVGVSNTLPADVYKTYISPSSQNAVIPILQLLTISIQKADPLIRLHSSRQNRPQAVTG